MKKFSYKNLSIFNKLLSLVVFAVLPLFLIFIFNVIPTVSNKYMVDKQNSLKNVVESTYNILEYYNQKVKNGDVSLEEAQSNAIEEINSLRYSGKEYYFMFDLDGTVMALGASPEKKGENWLDKKDHYGNYFIKDMVNTAKNLNEGFVTYYYPKLGETEAHPKLTFVKKFNDWNCFLASGVYIDDVEAHISEFRNDLLLNFILAILVAITIGFFVARSISKPLKAVQASAEKAASGDLNVSLDYKSKDEIGKLGNSFTVMVDNIRTQMVEIENKSKQAEEAMLESEKAKKEVENQQKYLTENTELLLSEMSKFSHGDLSVQLNSYGKDKLVANLFDGFNSAVNTIKETIAQVNESVLSTASAAAQISSSAEQMAAGAQEQSAQTSEVAAAIEEMSVTISETTKHVVETNNVAKDSRNLAQSGQVTIEETISGMKKIEQVVRNASDIISELGNSSEQIGEIIQVINDIADQTNLLALNAAIEAARAGENGRGFAVVADEVRKLAERTTKATDEIEGMIKKIQDDSKSAVDAIKHGNEEVSVGMEEATKAGSSMTEIVASSDKVLEISTQVAAASEEQSTAVEEISRSVEGINAITQESALGVQQIAGAATNLSHLADGLKDLVSQFKLNEETNNTINMTANKNYTKTYDTL